MTIRFQFVAATRILFGPGTLRDVPPPAKAMGKRAPVVTGQNRSRAGEFLGSLTSTGLQHVTLAVAGEPTTHLVQSGPELARHESAEIVIAIGRGSVSDAGKAIASLATNSGALLDHLEVIGRGRALENAPLSFIVRVLWTQPALEQAGLLQGVATAVHLQLLIDLPNASADGLGGVGAFIPAMEREPRRCV